MAVVGAFTGGNDGAAAAASTTVPNLNISGAGTAQPGDTLLVALNLNAGTTTLSSSSPTLAVESGGDVTGGGSYYLLALLAPGLTAAQIATDTIGATVSAAVRTLAAGILLRGRAPTGVLVPTVVKATTAATIALPSQASVPAGSDVIAIIAAHNAQATPPTISTANLVSAGYTVDKSAGTTYPSTSNFAIVIAHKANVAAGTYGGESIGITNTPTSEVAYLIVFPPDTPPFQPQRRRPWFPLRRRTSRQAAPPAQVDVPIPQPGRRARFAPPGLRRRAQQLPPATAAAPTTTPLPQPRHRAVPPPVLRRRRQQLPPTTAVAPATTPIPQPRRRFTPPVLRRSRPALPPTQVDVPIARPRQRFVRPALRRRTPPALPPQVDVPVAAQRRQRPLPPGRRTRAQQRPPDAAVAAPAPLTVPQPRRRLTPPWRLPRRPAALPPTAAPAVATAPLPQPRRRVLAPPALRRRTPQLPLHEDHGVPRARPRRRLVPPLSHRTRQATLPPASSAAAPSTIVIPTQRRRTWLPLRRRRTRALPPISPTVIPPSGFTYKAGAPETMWEAGQPTTGGGQ